MNNQEESNIGFVSHFALDKANNSVMPEELELFLAWKVIERKRTNSSQKDFSNIEIESLMKVYYPIWAIPFDDKIALVDPIIRQPSEIHINGVSSVNSFIDQLQGAHSNKSIFHNILNAHQKTFDPITSSKTKYIPGLLKGVDATPIVEYIVNSGKRTSSSLTSKQCLGEFDYNVIYKQVSEINEIYKVNTEEIKQLELALSVLDTETNHQINIIKNEIEGIKAEYEHEIDSTKEILRHSINNLVKRKNAEIEIVASRFSEIKDILISDIRNFKKIHASLNREGGYLLKMANARVGVEQESSSRLIKNLLGDHPKRLKILTDEVSKIQYISKILEKEESQQLSAIEALYDELIKARSKVVSDLEIDLEIEVNKRLGELEKLSEMRMLFREKIGLLIESIVTRVEKIDWLTPNILKIKEPKIIFIPLYLAYYPKQKKQKRIIISGPGYFSSGLSPVGRSFDLEDRLDAISYKCKTYFEASLPALIQKENKLEEQIERLFKENASFKSIAPVVLEGLRLAYENKWIRSAVYQEFEKYLNQNNFVKPVQSY